MARWSTPPWQGKAGPRVKPGVTAVSYTHLDVYKRQVPPAASRSVEDFLAELIRPQVEAWLSAHLPELVQKMAAEEIARLTGKA